MPLVSLYGALILYDLEFQLRQPKSSVWELVAIKFNENRHFGPIHEFSVARICKWRHMENPWGPFDVHPLDEHFGQNISAIESNM